MIFGFDNTSSLKRQCDLGLLKIPKIEKGHDKQLFKVGDIIKRDDLNNKCNVNGFLKDLEVTEVYVENGYLRYVVYTGMWKKERLYDVIRNKYFD